MPLGRFRAIRRGFTLIELLVVIAIISLLISITTPSLSRARQQAKSTVCMATMNEMMKSVIAYGNDYAFQLPPVRYEARPPQGSGSGGGQPGQIVYHGWAEALYRTMYNDDDFSFDVSYPVMRNLGDRFKFWVCKEAQPASDSTGGHYRVYEESWRGNLETIRYRLPLIVDSNPNVEFAEDLERADVPNLRIAGLEGEAYIDERHYGGSNYAFKDGHVERSTRLKEDLAEDWDLDPRTPNR